MKRLLIFLALVVPLAAQDSPNPVGEQTVFGSVDLGYRWVSDLSGDRNTYRSVVNLNEGFRVRGLDFRVEDPSGLLFDNLTLFADNWGDPYNVGRLDAEREGIYRLTFNYRNIAYYNFLPTFGNTGLATGSLLNQRAFDIRRRLWSAELKLLPDNWIQPYVAFDRDSSSGGGISTFFGPPNQYPVATEIRDETNDYRGGISLQFRRWHLTVEQGATAFKDDQQVYSSEHNLGSRTTPLLGNELFLDGLHQADRIRGSSRYSRALFTAAPAPWANFQAQFLFSQPESEVTYGETAAGLFYLGATRFYNALEGVGAGEATQPHTSGSFTAEIRPHSRVRILESYSTDRLHNASFLLATERLLLEDGELKPEDFMSSDRLVMNYNRQQAEVAVDVTSKLTVRGGHRYEWGDSTIRAATLNPSGNPETGELKRNSAILGFNYRPGGGALVNVEYELTRSDASYFRTSLHDYQRLRARGRVSLMDSLLLSLHLRLLDNENPAVGIEYDSKSIAAGASLEWRPNGGQRVSLLGDYTWSSYKSDIGILLPPRLRPADSFYRDLAHTISGRLEVKLPSSHQVIVPVISVGGSMFLSSGSRPTSYYQPVGTFLVPLHEHVTCYAEWRWYGLSQAFYTFEGFRTHHLLTGLRLSL